MQQGYGGYGPPQQGGPAGYGAPPAAGYGPAPQGAAYEFNADQDKKIATLGQRLLFAGIMQIVVGVGQLCGSWVFGLANWFAGAPVALALIVVGALFISAGSSFKQIQATQGNDMGHLMEAVGKLSTAAIVQIIGYILAFLAFILVIILVIFVFAAAAAMG